VSDPKFGWHIYWIVPVYILAGVVTKPVYWIKAYRSQRRKNRFLKENPEAAEMIKLAGINVNANK
jgi:Flp pilus assembly protein TadB